MFIKPFNLYHALEHFLSRFQNELTGIHATLAVIAFLQLVLAIIHSAYCCAASCCASHSGGVVVSCM